MIVSIRLSLRNRILVGNISLIAASLLLFAFCARLVIGSAIMNALDASLQRQARGYLRPHPGGPRPERLVNPGPDGNGPPRGPGFAPPPRLRDPNRPDPNGPGPDGNGPPAGDAADNPPAQDANARIGADLARPLRPRFIATSPTTVNPDTAEAAYSTTGLNVSEQSGHPDWRDEVDDNTGDTLRVFSMPVRGPEGGLLGVVQTTAPRADTDRAIGSLTFGLLLLLPVIALLAAGGGVLLTRQALEPIGRLADAAARIEASRLSDRLPESGGNDEFDRLTRMLNGSLSRLEESFARQKRFAADASHELRTPLAVIKTATSLLQEPELPADLRNEALRDADQAADRATRLISDLLFFARSEGRTLPVRPSSVAISELLARVAREAETASRRNETKAAPITVDAPPSLMIHTDGDLLQRILLNLLSNALRYTPQTGRVTIDAHHSVRGIVLTVQDTGQGIAPEHLARLGEPFYRPDKSRTREDGGAGLGLSISRAIAQTLGGTLTIESIVGTGTRATVTIPPYRSQEPPDLGPPGNHMREMYNLR